MLKDEIKCFKQKYNPNMVSCCSHGAKENVILGISSNVLLENVDYHDFGIEFEAYDNNMYNAYKIYHIMDNNIRQNFGFSYKSNPIDGINAQKQNIVFLAHPGHWWFSFKEIIHNILALVILRTEFNTGREFERIAK